MKIQLSFVTAVFMVLSASNGNAQDSSTAKVDFDRDIKLILSDRCFTCHGPDGQQREAGLRLDLKEDAMEVITAGDPEDSELFLRIESDDVDEMMPPPESNLTISESERKLIQKWIQEGADWKMHWAFEPVSPVAPPSVKQINLVENEIDRFVLSQLESNELSFSAMANRERLIRRVTFDLTGLPPTLNEIDRFVTDESSNAYEKAVDRLLASDHYGQRMASDWLDVARYSDTYGYQVDRDRFVWPWRDWVIRAFNTNQPYDRFITEQIAGDLLPNATDDQILATTFNRLHPQKVEGGSVEEEFRVEYVADRTQTMATAFLGLTLECARCHDHKYDPLSQKEYYQLFSFFNNIDEAGLYSFFTESVPTPTLSMVDANQRNQLKKLGKETARLARMRSEWTENLQTEFEKWLSDRVANSRPDSPAIEFPDAIETVNFETVNIGRNQRTAGPNGKTAIQLTGDDEVGLTTGNFTRYQPFSITCSINTPDVKDRAVVFHRSRAWTDAGSRGYQLLIEDGKLSASLIHFWPGNAIRVRTTEDVPVHQWIDVAVVYAGVPTAENLNIYIDGERQTVEIVRDNLTKNITGGGHDQLAIGARFRDRGFSNGLIAAMSVHDRQLSGLEIASIREPQILAEINSALHGGNKLPDAHTQLLSEHFMLHESPSNARLQQELMSQVQQLCKTEEAIREIMVMRELSQPRKAFVLHRGAYDSRLDEVTANTPAIFPDLDSRFPNNRLGLAKWLTDRQNPLTARVAVNHFWQVIFGEGLVRTPEDFGRQGKPPSHPELLDWLAADFVDHEWNVKRLLKQLVMSRTYRQSSDVTRKLLTLDPDNLMLSRFPSYRLSAEMLRDNALSVSGLLVDKIGGPSVKPYDLAASFKPSPPDTGEGLYRRSVYTYWKRTGPAPVMMTLDAAKRDVCRVKRERTSTPLQALVMLNGPQFVEASRALGYKLIEKHGVDSTDRILVDMFRLLTGRIPSKKEQSIVLALFEQQRTYFEQNPLATREYLDIGQFGTTETAPKPVMSDAAVDLAAWASVANTLLNHDECGTKR